MSQLWPLCIFALSLLTGFFRCYCKQPQPKLPPGPRPMLVLGNLLDWPRGNAWLKFYEWHKSFGDIVHIQMLGQHIIILNTFAAAKDLMDKPVYSDRPSFTMAKLMGFIPSMILSRYGESWKLQRRLAQRAMTKTAVAGFSTYLEENVSELLDLVLHTPSNYRASLRYFIGKTIMKTTYGITVTSPHDLYITVSEATHEDLAYALIPGSFFVDVLPCLRYVPTWMPGASFKRHAARVRKQAWTMVEKPFLHVKEALQRGTAPYSFVSSVLSASASSDEGPDTSEYEHAVKWAAGSLYGAGGESAFAVLSTFFFLMAVNPTIQANARAEIDHVVGRGSRPSLNDREKLPYLEAILKETLRWHTPVPLGVARRLMEDDDYLGYRVPSQSIVFANIWAISQDAANYPNPSDFCPERFLREPPDLDPFTYAFGFGRRICVGSHYSSSLIFIAMASILSTFTIELEEKAGDYRSFKPQFSPNFTSYTEPFPCRITPRRSTIPEEM